MSRSGDRQSIRVGAAAKSRKRDTRKAPVSASADSEIQAAKSHHRAGRLADAKRLYAEILSRQPDNALALNLLGMIAYQEGDFRLAIDRIDKAIALRPRYAEAHSNVGSALKKLDRFDEAVAAYRKALDLRPDFAEVHFNLGNALKEQGKLDEATAAHRRALALNSELAGAHYNLGLALMSLGKLDEGFREYEWRWKTDEFRPREFRQPQWSGLRFAGETVLIHAEQGLGDAIQFVRYAPLVRARGGRVVFECPKSLLRLLRGVDGIDHFVARGKPLPSFDFHVPLLSLPHILGTILADIPADVPYLSVPDGVAAPALEPADGRLRVGIVWQGNTKHKNDRNRSCPLRHFEALARRNDVTLYSLQVGPGAADLKGLATDAPIHDLGARLGDFADTAAAIAELDLVITVDTAVAHLAGAMARPIWTLLPFAPDWRWLLERDDSPWYPTMRLFRQSHQGDWDGVFDRVGRALEMHAAYHT